MFVKITCETKKGQKATILSPAQKCRFIICIQDHIPAVWIEHKTQPNFTIPSSQSNALSVKNKKKKLQNIQLGCQKVPNFPLFSTTPIFRALKIAGAVDITSPVTYSKRLDIYKLTESRQAE